MGKKRNSLLSKEEQKSLEIEDFIFHIVRSDSKPTFFDEANIPDQKQKEYFKDIIIKGTVGTQYKFQAKEGNFILPICKKLATYQGDRFISESKKLAQHFNEHHRSNMKSGIVIISKVSMTIQTKRKKFVSILKVDYEAVYQNDTTRENGKIRAILKEVYDSIVRDKKTIQKWAFIDVGDNFEWDVLAMERGKAKYDSDEAITKYFKKFLMVDKQNDDRTLTKKLVNEIFNWARKNEKILPKEEKPNDYRAKTVDFMNRKVRLTNTNELLDFVIPDSNLNQRKELLLSLNAYLNEQGLSNQSFKPTPEALAPTEKKNILTTSQGVVVTWEGDDKKNGIEIGKKGKDGYHIITIKTRKYELK